MRRKRPSRRDSGQAAVETAIVMPLTIFMVLGLIQLFLTMEARALAQYATARATRAGSLNSADCVAMRHAAIATLLPSFDPLITGIGAPPDAAGLAAAFAARPNAGTISGFYNTFTGLHGDGMGANDAIVWIDRVNPTAAAINAIGNEEEVFDLTTIGPNNGPNGANLQNLEVRMIFWFPLRIPFANFVMAMIANEHWNVGSLLQPKSNPMLTVQSNPNWGVGAAKPATNLTAGVMTWPLIAAELRRRLDVGHYVFPIETTYTMRMMSPARPVNLTPEICE